ncbi:MBL fold metallo-hydrolase [Sphingomonas bacterium]|uniref:MBL fold metallo-hydrolase n=1 Tax=Sphingomonas bacterium TaxID=1895847 RepID=UPI002616BB40|nr:MBL fold metallo-hydrolase [Sphingomonas bacterium]MDB5678429.1 fold metallo-hydrolase [Sphingomonas bacterium]
MRTKLLAAIAAVVIVIAGAAAFQRQIGATVLSAVFGARAGLDRTTDLPDGLHVALCGTGSPLPDPGRAGACTVIIAGKHIFVVDSGEGGARNIALMGIPNGRIEGVFLTHFHSDHIDGLGPMMLLRWTGFGATSRLPIYGPPGVDKVVAGFDAAYALDSGYRTAHHGPVIAPPSGAGGVAMPFAIPPRGSTDRVVVYEKDGLRVSAFRVDHGPVDPAVGYRFDYKGRSAVVSGDTTATPTLVVAARNVDLLIHEGLQPKLVGLMTAALTKRGITGTAQVTRDILGYHATPEMVAKEAQAAGVRYLVFNHIIPQVPSRTMYPAFLGDARSLYDGPITVGEDGMLFSLPAGSRTIVFDRLPVN